MDEHRERVLACITPDVSTPHLTDAAALEAQRWHANLWALHVTPNSSWSHLSRLEGQRLRRFLDSLPSTRSHAVVDEDTGGAIVRFGAEHGMTQIFLGHGRGYSPLARRIVQETTARDVHIVAWEGEPRPPVTVPNYTESEGLLVCLSGLDVLHRARSTADSMRARAYAVHVAPDENWTGVSPGRRERIEALIHQARGLQFQTYVLYGAHIGRTLIDFTIRHGVRRVVLGPGERKGFLKPNIVNQILRLAPWLDVQIVTGR